MRKNNKRNQEADAEDQKATENKQEDDGTFSKGINKRQRKSKIEEEGKNSNLVDKSAMFFFKNQQYGSKGIRKEMKRYSTSDIRIDPDDYYNYYTSYTKKVKKEASLPAEQVERLLWLGITNQNILIYGFGEKVKFVEDYANEYLEGEDVLEVFGNNHSSFHNYDPSPNLWIRILKSLLNTISDSILKDTRLTEQLNEMSLQQFIPILTEKLNTHYGRVEKSAGEANPSTASSATLGVSTSRMNRRNPNKFLEWKGKWAHVQSRLYLIIHDITSPVFASADAQECLSLLASCDSITMIATATLLNMHLLWDSLALSRYAWTYFPMNTFQHSKIPYDHPLIRNIVTGPGGIIMKENTGENLIPVLKSFGRGHIEFLQKIGDTYFKAKKAIINNNNSTKNSENDEELPNYFQNGFIVFPFKDALEIALNSLIVKRKADLTVLIKELIDHRLLLHIFSETKGEFLKFLISEDDFQKIVIPFKI